MKTCPECTMDNEDDASICVSCKHRFAPSEGGLRAATGEGGAKLLKKWEAPPPTPTITFDLRQPAEPKGEEPRPRLDPEPAAAEDGDDKAAVRKTKRSQLDRDLLRFEKSGKLTIGIIGFATSGKTFLLNRLKEQVLRTRDYKPVPAHADNGTKVQGTPDIETHDFVARRTTQPPSSLRFWQRRPDPQDFHVIDIPGEQFRRAVAARLQSEESKTLIRVLRLSHALILVLPADDVFARLVGDKEEEVLEGLIEKRQALRGSGGPNQEKLTPAEKAELEKLERRIANLGHVQADDRLDSLLTTVSMLSAHASEIEGDDAKLKAVAAYIRKGDLEIAGLKRGAAAPVYIALAKADLVIKPKLAGYPHVKEPMLLDSDPATAVRIHRQELYERICECFSWHKFDFVTCFKDQPVNDLTIRYRRRHFGMGEVVDWIIWARDHSLESGRRKPRGAFALTRGDARRLFHALLVAATFWLAGFGWAWVIGSGAAAGAILWLLKNRIGLVRRLGKWREDGAATDPTKVGLDPKKYGINPEDPDHKIPRWIAAKIESAVAPSKERKSFLSRFVPIGVTFLAVVAAAVISMWLLGWFTRVEPTAQGYSFPARPVYAADIERMERDNNDFRGGFIQNEVAKWEAIPNDGGWFNFQPASGALSPLRSALDMLPARGEPGVLSPAQAERVRAALTDATGQDPSETRGANNYHRGLTYLLEREYSSAAQAFRQALTQVQARLAAANPGTSAWGRRRFTETTNRLHAAQISILYALGLTELKRGRWADAATALQSAWEIAQRERTRGIEAPTSSSSFWFTVSTQERLPMLHVPTADIWTNLLVALMRQHGDAMAAGGGTGADELRARLEGLVREASDHADEAGRHPRLAANLRIAALRSGARAPVAEAEDGEELNLQSRFRSAGGAPREVAAAEQTAAMIANPQGQADPRAAYWRATQEWRAAFSGSGRRGQQLVSAIDRRLDEIPDDREDLRAWLCDVMETEFREASPSAKREITRNYGRYYCNAREQQRFWDAATPFGLVHGGLLALILFYAIFALRGGWRRLKRDYRSLFNPKHHLDRMGIP